ncbi:MAG: T9SS type A sorting domain-containing protein [Bacteroidales bacterium]|nr:T9SS type A sorting domain-containing protein [Bacteroidales bacterium]MCF8458675.1 T9SS type A sorting domain-containing protein [Bacteroidales bacterium]
MKPISLLAFFLLAGTIFSNAQTTFGEPFVLVGHTYDPYQVIANDIDGDGDNDILAISRSKISLFRNSNGVFSPQEVIASVIGGQSIAVSDIDGDGDKDILSSSYEDDIIAWYENLDGNGTFGPKNIINVFSSANAAGVFALDFDNDGDQDVIARTGFFIAWFENIDGQGSFGPYQIIFADQDGSFQLGDIDGDGDVDFIGGSCNELNAFWFENTDGAGTWGPLQIISDSIDGICGGLPFDLDSDGDLDILTGSYNNSTLMWYENISGTGTFGPSQLISDSAINISFISAYDLDGDGDLDILTASYQKKIVWYENTNGNSLFAAPQLITSNIGIPTSLFSSDLDGDGDMDVLSTSREDDKIAWYENTNGLGAFGTQQIITETSGSISSFFIDDLDGDGDNDILTSSHQISLIGWHENNGSISDFGHRQNISFLQSASYVIACDVDGDNDLDAIAGSNFYGKLVWFDNVDGSGNFSPTPSFIDSIEVSMLYPCDIDGDGHDDILVVSYSEDKILWYRNQNGTGSFVPQQSIIENINSPMVTAQDIDGDGDLDVLSVSSYLDSTLAWYENIDGLGSFGPQIIISDTLLWAGYVFACDMDGDGDIDVLASPQPEDTVLWYENIDGAGNFQTRIFSTSTNYGTRIIYPSDLDGDGDYDLLVSGEYGPLVWHENTDGFGNFGSFIEIPSSHSSTFIRTSDLDNDGDQDIVLRSGGYFTNIEIIENLTIVSVPQIKRKNTIIYPNPSNEKLYFDVDASSIKLITIFDITGKTILEEHDLQEGEHIDISCLKPGLYIIRMETDHETLSSKFVKE